MNGCERAPRSDFRLYRRVEDADTSVLFFYAVYRLRPKISCLTSDAITPYFSCLSAPPSPSYVFHDISVSYSLNIFIDRKSHDLAQLNLQQSV